MSLRVMVTGASGFVGRAFCAACVQRGNEVVAAVRTAQGAHVFDRRVEEVAVGDLGTPIDWHAALQGVDVVVHLAARAHVLRGDSSDPLQAFRRVNVSATLALARQVVAAGVKRFVFLSSVGVNGAETFGEAFTEMMPPMPHSFYAKSKHEAELGLIELGKQSGLEVVIIRPPLVYGTGAPGNFGKLVRVVQAGIPLPFGTVHNLRSLVALDNLVDFTSCCLSHPAAAGEVFLISDGEDVSTTTLLRRVAQACGVPPRLVPVPVSWMRLAARALGRSDMATSLLGSLVLSNAKAREILGWQPLVTMNEQLKKMGHHAARA